MALEQFKTQVLLLHSQQSILDTLSAGFNERYAVHQATSGSEALLTLGETPIDILISAQDLPGMSGVEALREAKRRSPETIGILLANNANDPDLEALVGEQEMFQVVQGNIDPGTLLRIVDNAARNTRMLAMAESANDNEARDSSAFSKTPMPNAKTISESGEHIVMETMDNGASVITDGTNRMLALDTGAATNATDASVGPVSVMVLSRDSNFIAAVRGAAKDLHAVHHAETPQQALDILAGHSIGVLVTDAAVAGNNIAQLMQKLRTKSPRLVGIVAGRRDDGEALMELINLGHIYRFLLKPLSPGRARLAIEASAKYHVDAPAAAFRVRKPVQPNSAPAATAAAPTARKTGPQTGPAAPTGHSPGPSSAPLAKPTQLGSMSEKNLAATRAAVAAQSKRKPPSLVRGIVGLLAVLVAGGAWFFFGSGFDDPVSAPTDAARAPSATAGDVQTGASAELPAAASQPAYLVLLDNARFARDSGRVLSPPGDNAIEWYLEARRENPQNAIIRDELLALIDQLIGNAEIALLQNRRSDAEAALAMIALADPENPRLAFITAQLQQATLRDTLDNARAAIRDSRFENAAGLLAQASEMPGADREIIEQLTADLASARSARRIDGVLALANQRIASDQLTAPRNDNARYFFELANSIEPGNPAARQGLLIVASKLVLKARTSLDSGDLDNAALYLSQAQTLDPDSPEMQATTAALQNALSSATPTGSGQETLAATPGDSPLQNGIESRLGATGGADATVENAIAAAQAPVAGNSDDNQAVADNVATFGLPQNATAANKPAGLPLAGNVSDRNADADNPGPIDAGNTQRTNAGAGETGTVNADVSLPGGVAQTPTVDRALPDAAAAAGARVIKQVPVSELVRTRYVAPRYPRGAQRRNVSGWVDVSFVVEANGNVSAVEILASAPDDIFNEAATRAVAKWVYEPSYEDGQAVARRAAVRISFNLE